MKDIILNAISIEKRYTIDGNSVDVLNGIDLTVFKSDIIAIVGPSGAGKSTFLHILGLLEKPTKGKIIFQGFDIGLLDDFRLAEMRLKNIGFVFQFHHLLPEFSALENVMLPALMKGFSKLEASDRAEEMLGKVGLKHRLKHKPGELSGGEQQRVALARALVNDPELILADEPTGNLDTVAALQLRDLLWDICREQNTALIIVTHNYELATNTSKLLTLREGKLY